MTKVFLELTMRNKTVGNEKILSNRIRILRMWLFQSGQPDKQLQSPYID